ncbi:hypothetical protein N826_02180 [Skermanella aerolata KACC 11604]|nr:hypothetical protein N826_02180 [Skermanella aerolata KACC 11604]
MVLFIALLTKTFILNIRFGMPDIEDDAFYYIVIAKNIAETSLSTFDGAMLTNGYHPLWTAILAAWIYFFGDAIIPIKFLEALILSISLYYLIRLIQPANILSQAIAFGFFYYAVNATSYMGMETTILFLAYTALIVVLSSYTHFIADNRGLVAGAAAVLCIAAQIEAAVFVIPVLILTLPSNKDRIYGLAMIGAAGIGYAVANQVVFGTPAPISGEIKSFGGFHVNELFIEQLRSEGFKGILTGNYATVVVFYISSLAFLLSSFVNKQTKLIIVGLELGLLVFIVKLAFFSSWRVWEWYRFPIYLIVVPALIAGQDLLRQRNSQWRSGTPERSKFHGLNLALLGIAVMMGVIWPAYRTARALAYNQKMNFYDVNEEVAYQYRSVFGSSLVAMGDRAGSFAYYNGGHVLQLEGLVNDKAYSEMLRTASDATEYLCRHDVKFVVDYDRDLGDYGGHSVDIFKAKLTSFKGPKIPFSKEDEVGRYVNLALYDNSRSDVGDNYIYVWRLDCH